jgi:hypothetical protein
MRSEQLTIVALIAIHASAQQSPSELAEQFTRRYSSGAAEEFAKVFPFPSGREMLRRSTEWKVERTGAYAKVLEQQGKRATLLLGGYLVIPNTGDETSLTQGFSGMYEAVREGGTWKIKTQIPIDAGNRILAHKLEVSVTPGRGLKIRDRMGVEVNGTHGFTAMLNHGARIAQILWNDQPVDHAFGGGVIWLPLRKGSGVVTLDYEIAVEHGPDNTNSACFLENAGHVRNQYYWHPFFGFFNGNDTADFEITVRIPAAYHVATSLPQTDRVDGDTRIVSGRSTRGAEALTLLYDRDWKPVSVETGEVRLQLFMTPDFEPRPESILATFRENYELLRAKFGTPPGGYVSIVQSRARGDNGWRYSSNQAIVGGTNGASLTGPDGTNFFHEIAHSWTKVLGPAAHFLDEGWATYAESLYLRAKVNSEAEKRFWKMQSDIYFNAFDGKVTILNDTRNGGIAYRKGSWVFRMLEHVLGESTLHRALAEFSKRSLQKSGSLEVFLQCLQQASGKDMTSFVMPWLKENTVPRFEARTAGNRVVLTQVGPLFDLPLEIALETEAGTQRRPVRVSQRETTVIAESAVKSVAIDPDGRFLLNRK